MRHPVVALAVALSCLALPVIASGGGHSHSSGASLAHSSSGAHSSSSHSTTGSHNTTPPWVHRDSHGKIARDPRQTEAFKKQHACPATGKTYGPCHGYVIDHITPLKRGGSDAPSNMQWQT
jgi:hypothetical protein